MSVLSLPKTGHTQIYVSGDVIIDETAAIAPGVILQATANGRIIIKAGACIGMGTVLTANQGTIEIGEGAILGAGVLIVGSGKISDRACIGTASTLIETSVNAMEVIAPGTLLVDSSRQETLSSPPASNNHTEPESNGSHPSPQPDISPPAATSAAENNGSQVNGHTPNPTQSDGETAEDNHQTPPDSDSSSQQQPPSSTTIYGQTHIERLMVTLFPHKEKTKKEDE
jgi:carbon dioxide concentrating mechanism protein CcmN